jgi:hypothetical protein
MSKIKVYEKDGRLAVILPGNQVFRFEQDGDLQASNGTASDEVTITFTQNSEIFVLDYAFGNFVAVDGTTQLGSTRADTVTALNALFDKPPQLRDNLDVNGKTITSASNGDVVIDPDGTGAIMLKSNNIKMEGDGSVDLSVLKFFEAPLLDGNYVGLKGPLSVVSDVEFTLPGSDGTANQCLKTDGNGTLSFATYLREFSPTVNGAFTITAAASGTLKARLRLYDDDGSNYAQFQVPNNLAADYTLTLPANDGDANQVLQTNGSGVLSWVDQSSGGSSTSDGWHGHTTKIKVMPSEFVGSDEGRALTTVYIEDDNTNELGARINAASGSCYAFVPIPTGYKATGVRVNTGSTVTNGVTALHYDITDGTTSNSQSFNTNAQTTLTNELTSSDDDVLVLKVSPGSVTEDIYGATVTIAAV